MIGDGIVEGLYNFATSGDGYGYDRYGYSGRTDYFSDNRYRHYERQDIDSYGQYDYRDMSRGTQYRGSRQNWHSNSNQHYNSYSGRVSADEYDYEDL